METNDTVDMSCAIYGDGSHLLCHDDDLAERRIAYIIYFVSEVRSVVQWVPELPWECAHSRLGLGDA